MSGMLIQEATLFFGKLYLLEVFPIHNVLFGVWDFILKISSLLLYLSSYYFILLFQVQV
jgi:hypothetical protein